MTDTERLDWLETMRQPTTLILDDTGAPVPCVHWPIAAPEGMTVRQAIDTMMAAGRAEES